MSFIYNSVVYLSDPQHTADFQTICGIRSVQKKDDNEVCASRSNGQLSKCEEIEKECESQNLNGDAHSFQNGSLPRENGAVASGEMSLTKRHGLKNGLVENSNQNEFGNNEILIGFNMTRLWNF